MIPIDVSIDVPVLATARVTSDVEPVGTPFGGGILLDVGVVPLGTTTLVTTVGVRGWGATWDSMPGFQTRVYDISADFGARWSPGAENVRLVHGWWGVGQGIRVGVLDADYWEGVAAPGIGGWVGGGATIGKGQLRGTFSVRADATLRIDAWNATVVTGEGTTTWAWHPGSARIEALVGVAFR